MSSSPNTPAPISSAKLHPRNRHQGRYDFPALIKACPELAAFVITNPYGKPSIDFADPQAVKVFNRALLQQFYGIRYWDIPEGYLCPPIPGRADYIHGLADLLALDNHQQIPRGQSINVLDIGCGANCIYPLIGQAEYGWQFVGADISKPALAAAQVLVQSNALHKVIQLRQQTQARQIFQGIIQTNERFALSLCNPPFHASLEEATQGSRRKWRNLGKLDPKRSLPKLNFGGQAAELYCEGGELAFIKRMATESRDVANQVAWFSTLVSKAGHVPLLQAQLKRLGAHSIQVVDMGQGQKRSRFVAWSYLDAQQRLGYYHPLSAQDTTNKPDPTPKTADSAALGSIRNGASQ